MKAAAPLSGIAARLKWPETTEVSFCADRNERSGLNIKILRLAQYDDEDITDGPCPEEDETEITEARGAAVEPPLQDIAVGEPNPNAPPKCWRKENFSGKIKGQKVSINASVC